MSNYLKSVNIQFVPSDTDNSCPNNLQFSFFSTPHLPYETTNLGPWCLGAGSSMQRGEINILFDRKRKKKNNSLNED